MTLKSKLAATVLNTFYVIERGLELKRIKRVPGLKAKYALLESYLDTDHGIKKAIKAFTTYNNSAFNLNIGHFIDNDPVMRDLSSRVSTTKGRVNISTSVWIKDAGPSNGRRVSKLQKSLSGVAQDGSLSQLLKDMSPVFHTIQGSYLVIKTPCFITNFYLNMREVDTEFLRKWNAIKTLLSIDNYVFDKMSKEEVEEVMSERAFINFTNPRIEENVFMADGFAVVETEAAKTAREVRERLEAAIKRRTKHVKKITCNEDSIEYLFEEDHPPLRINLDVITQW